MELHFDESLLKAKVAVESVGASKYVGANDAKLANVKIIETELRRDANAPIDWFEGCVAVEEIEAEAQSLVKKGLLTAAKETGAARLCGAYAARRRNAPAIEKCFR